MEQPTALLIEPFCGGSHQQLVDLLASEFRNCRVHAAPAKKWHWRMRTAALHFARTIPAVEADCKVLFVSSVLNLAELCALRPDLARLRKVLYFHENQLVYPIRKQQERDFQFGYNQILSCLVADVVVFNSAFNRDSLLSNIEPFLKLMPDLRPKGLADDIRPKCLVLHFPLCFKQLTNSNNPDVKSPLGAENTESTNGWEDTACTEFSAESEVCCCDSCSLNSVPSRVCCKNKVSRGGPEPTHIWPGPCYAAPESNCGRHAHDQTVEKGCERCIVSTKHTNKFSTAGADPRVSTARPARTSTRNSCSGLHTDVSRASPVAILHDGSEHLQDSGLFFGKQFVDIEGAKSSNGQLPGERKSFAESSGEYAQASAGSGRDCGAHPSLERKNRALHIVWPHRWEHDKNPSSFFAVLRRLAEDALPFSVSVLGETFNEVPTVFEESQVFLEDHISHWGYLPSRQAYTDVLSSADVVISTAEHEFFGVAMLEAAFLGCYPLCPNRLVYPEIFPKECLYNTDTQLFKRLREFCRCPRAARRKRPLIDFSRFDWRVLRPQYAALLSA